jgi:hypothetical protein
VALGERLSRLLALGVDGPVRTAAGGPDVTAAGRVAVSRAMVGAANVPWGVGPPLAPVDVVDPWTLFGWVDRDAAMSLPTISRARDLLVSAVSALPLTRWRHDNTVLPPADVRIADASWFDRPDPDRTRQWLLAWTTDDLVFYGLAWWRVTGRFADTFPSSFRRVAPGCLDLQADHAMVTDPSYNGGCPERVALTDLVQFLSPLEGLLTNGGRPIAIALSLDDAASRFASTEIPAGWVQEREGSEDLAATELAKLAADFTAARRNNTIAALNKWTEYHEATYDPSKMQVVEGRTYQALELSRLGNIPGYLTGAPAGTGMTYLNAAQAKADLIDFGAAPLIGCIEATLSGPNVTPSGQLVKLDRDAWLGNPFDPTTGDTPTPPATDPAAPAPEQLSLPLGPGAP